MLTADSTDSARLDEILVEIRHRRNEYARPPVIELPTHDSIRPSEFRAVTLAAADILAEDGRLTVTAIATRLKWKSLGRVSTVFHALRRAGGCRWILHRPEGADVDPA